MSGIGIASSKSVELARLEAESTDPPAPAAHPNRSNLSPCPNTHRPVTALAGTGEFQAAERLTRRTPRASESIVNTGHGIAHSQPMACT